jgi:hypothetical protein
MGKEKVVARLVEGYGSTLELKMCYPEMFLAFLQSSCLHGSLGLRQKTSMMQFLTLAFTPNLVIYPDDRRVCVCVCVCVSYRSVSNLPQNGLTI